MPLALRHRLTDNRRMPSPTHHVRLGGCWFMCLALAACGAAATTGSGGASSGGASGNGSGGVSGGSGGSSASGGAGTGGAVASGGVVGSGGAVASGGRMGSGGTASGGLTGAGGTLGSGGAVTTGGSAAGGRPATGGATSSGGVPSSGGAIGSGGLGQGGRSCAVASGSTIGTITDPVGKTDISPPDPPGIAFKDSDGKPVNAHGGGIIQVCDTFYLHGEYFPSTSTENNFNGFSMYSSKDLATWKNEGIILPQQASGELGPNRKGERPHIIKCPSSGEFVLYAHAADTTYQADKEIVYATSPTVNGQYSYKGPLKNANGDVAAHSDMSALSDGNNAYVITESGWVYTLAGDCHSWTTAKAYSAVNGTTGGIEAPTVFKAGNTYYWIGSDKTGWRANDDFYSTAPAMSGPWTYQGYLAPMGKKTWMTQSTWVLPVTGSQGTVYVYWGDHWYGTEDTTAPGKHNDMATYVFQPLVFTGTNIGLPTYQVSWKLDVGAGTWSK